EFGLAGRRLGAEFGAYGLNHALGKRREATLDGFCTLEDGTGLIDRLRLIKSPAEMAYVRRAAELADLALDAAHRTIAPG
ncbi:hypothetical protein ABTM70_20650, partial [Acinetobacter baumannii]